MKSSSDMIRTHIYLFIFLSVFGRIALKTVDETKVNIKHVSRKEQMHVTLAALEKTIAFYSQNIDKVNLDSVFGLRVGQGGLNKALTESKGNVEDEMFKRLIAIHGRIKDLGDQGFNKLKSMDSSYFHKFEHLIDGKWFAIMPYHHVDLSLVHEITLHDDTSFDESSSDHCMTNLIGSQLDGIQKKCQVTNECWELMTKKGADGYYLTHQGLFLILAENRGCRAEVLDKVGNDDQWLHQVRDIAANIYHQMVKTYNQKKTDDNSVGKDLFAEQIVVCQMLGVLECFDVKFLNVILNQQDASGCWKQPDNENGDADPNLGAQEVITEDMKKGEPQEIVRFKGRKLQEDLVLQDGCSAHFTGVATGCLGLYAYWFASHPDTFGKARQQIPNDKNSIIYSSLLTANQNNDAMLLLAVKWAIVFLFVTFFFYFFRKWRRSSFPMLRKYRKLSI